MGADHFVSRALRQLGHCPRVIPAISEAALRLNLKLVKGKT